MTQRDDPVLAWRISRGFPRLTQREVLSDIRFLRDQEEFQGGSEVENTLALRQFLNAVYLVGRAGGALDVMTAISTARQLALDVRPPLDAERARNSFKLLVEKLKTG